MGFQEQLPDNGTCYIIRHVLLEPQDTLVGIELMHIIKKRQVVVEEGDEGLTAAEQFSALAA